MADGEGKSQEILERLRSEGKNLKVINEWITEAVNHISDKKLQTVCLEHWNGIKSEFGAEEFDLRSLF